MYVTLIALGSRGEVVPYIAPGEALSQAGHRVRFATFENFQEIVTANGLQHSAR